jgi:hypothetical protein
MLEDLRRHIGKFYGKYSGEVTKNDTDKDNMGRIVVTVPSVFGVDTEVTARPCLPYGYFFVPAVKTKVWIEFEGGDTDCPIWVGTWYPQGTTPQPAAIAPPDNRVIQTASGHTIEIMDKAGEEKITIRHKLNSFVAIDKDGSIIIGNHKGSTLNLNAKDEYLVLVDQHSNSVTMTDNGVVIVNKDGSAAVELSADIARVAAKNIVLQGSSVAVGADAAEPTILGTTFAQMYNTHTHGTALGTSTPPSPTGPPLGPPPKGQGLTSAVAVK